MLDLDTLKKLCKEATPGPWLLDRKAAFWLSAWASTKTGRTMPTGQDLVLKPTKPNLAFVIGCRDALPDLIALVDAADKMLLAQDLLTEGRLESLRRNPPGLASDEEGRLVGILANAEETYRALRNPKPKGE